MILDAVQSVLISSGRSIGTIIPNVVIEEIHRDDLIVTDHPVEKGQRSRIMRSSARKK